jgi:phosphatidylglycerophosphatase C
MGRELAARRTVVRQAVAQCRLAHLQGKTIVATASEETLARAFLDAVDLPDIPLLASRLEFTPRGALLAVHNVGEAKLHAIRAAGSEPEEAVLYTDSASDLPLARTARRTVAVNAAPHSFKKLAASARGIDRRRWR